MSSWDCVYLLLVMSGLSNWVNCGQFCGNRSQFHETKGLVKTLGSGGMQNCSWTILTPQKSVLYFKIKQLQLGSYDELEDEIDSNCLIITSLDQKIDYLHLCTDDNYFDQVAINANEVLITLQAHSQSELNMEYSSYFINCSYDDLQCYSMRTGSYLEEVCEDGMLQCKSYCGYGKVECGSGEEKCYDAMDQRCDDVIDCPNGIDEMSCYPQKCPNKIRCSNESECISTQQICDGIEDCGTSFDEHPCTKFQCKDISCSFEANSENHDFPELTYFFIILFAVMLFIFFFLLCKCISNRPNFGHMLENPIEAAPPPFRGPGESSASTEESIFTDDDFLPGGEIYESFISNLARIKSKRSESQEVEDDIIFVKPLEGGTSANHHLKGVDSVLCEDMAALASIKLSREMCLGLRKARSEEMFMTKQLFIDNLDDGGHTKDPESDADYNIKFSEAVRSASASKSDSVFLRSKAKFHFVEGVLNAHPYNWDPKEFD